MSNKYFNTRKHLISAQNLSACYPHNLIPRPDVVQVIASFQQAAYTKFWPSQEKVCGEQVGSIMKSWSFTIHVLTD